MVLRLKLWQVSLRKGHVFYSRVVALALLRLAAKAIPTLEKRRSTVADDAGQPSY